MKEIDGPLNRRIWCSEEDEAIKQLVDKYGTKSWSLIAENILKEYNIGWRRYQYIILSLNFIHIVFIISSLVANNVEKDGIIILIQI